MKDILGTWKSKRRIQRTQQLRKLLIKSGQYCSIPKGTHSTGCVIGTPFGNTCPMQSRDRSLRAEAWFCIKPPDASLPVTSTQYEATFILARTFHVYMSRRLQRTISHNCFRHSGSEALESNLVKLALAPEHTDLLLLLRLTSISTLP